MHEAAVIRDLVAKSRAAAGGRRVAAVRLLVGALAAESPAHLRLHFETAAAGTALAGARLVIERDPDATSSAALGVRLVAIDVEDR